MGPIHRWIHRWMDGGCEAPPIKSSSLLVCVRSLREVRQRPLSIYLLLSLHLYQFTGDGKAKVIKWTRCCLITRKLYQAALCAVSSH